MLSKETPLPTPLVVEIKAGAIPGIRNPHSPCGVQMDKGIFLLHVKQNQIRLIAKAGRNMKAMLKRLGGKN